MRLIHRCFICRKWYLRWKPHQVVLHCADGTLTKTSCAECAAMLELIQAGKAHEPL